MLGIVSKTAFKSCVPNEKPSFFVRIILRKPVIETQFSFNSVQLG